MHGTDGFGRPAATVIVTGASSGIGHSLALAWARRGATVLLTARDEPQLRRVAREVELAGGHALVERADVTREEDRVRIVARARTDTGRIDVLVNNAGRGYHGGVANIDMREIEALFALNVFAPLRLTQLALDPLTRTGGAVVMISSVAGVVAAPGYGAYAASKFALEALSMALRAELVGAGVQVVVVRPGPVDTAFRDNAAKADGPSNARPRGAEVQSPDEVAEQTVVAVETGRPVVETTRFVRLASAAARVAPAAMRWIGAAMASRK
jgi:short-subunit dehydrogenase